MRAALVASALLLAATPALAQAALYDVSIDVTLPRPQARGYHAVLAQPLTLWAEVVCFDDSFAQVEVVSVGAAEVGHCTPGTVGSTLAVSGSARVLLRVTAEGQGLVHVTLWGEP